MFEVAEFFYTAKAMHNISYCRDAVYCFVENSDCLWCCHPAIKRWQKKTDALTRIGPYPNRKLPQ